MKAKVSLLKRYPVPQESKRARLKRLLKLCKSLMETSFKLHKFESVQYILAEMNINGFHKSLNDPLANSMFVKADNAEKPTKGKGTAISKAFLAVVGRPAN